MPVLIKTINQIIRERCLDTYFVRFGDHAQANRYALLQVREDHLAWFDTKGIVAQTAAPEGWLEGDPGCIAVYFDGRADPRLHEYCAAYEHPDGRSLHPELYQMYLVPFQDR